MGNYAFLNAALRDRVPASRDEFDAMYAAGARELESKYLLPVFWLAMFAAGDIRDGNLIAPAAAARATLARRRTGLARFVGDKFHELLAQFVDFTAELQPFVLMRLDDIASMSAPAQFAAGLVEVLAAVAEFEGAQPISTRARKALEHHCGLGAQWRDSQWVVGILSGHAPGWPPDPNEAAWRAAMATATGPVRDFDPTIAWKLGEQVRYLLHGDGVVTKLEGTKTEVLFRGGPVKFGRLAKAPSDPYAETTALGRFLRSPDDDALREAALDGARRELADGWLADETKLTRLIGPLARVVRKSTVKFRRGFVSGVTLESPYDIDRGRAFLHGLGGSGAALLEHPLWRTVEEVDGEDADVALLATHGNFVSLRRLRMSLVGLARLARQPEPLRARAVSTTGNYGLPLEPRTAWQPLLDVGAFSELTEVQLNLRYDESAPITPADLAWLLESRLGLEQLRVLDLGTNGDMKLAVAPWLAAIPAHPVLERVTFAIKHASAWARFAITRGALAIDVDHAVDGIAEAIRGALAGVPRETRTKVTCKQSPDALVAALREDLDYVIT